jgi:hypothetical protein
MRGDAGLFRLVGLFGCQFAKKKKHHLFPNDALCVTPKGLEPQTF